MLRVRLFLINIPGQAIYHFFHGGHAVMDRKEMIVLFRRFSRRILNTSCLMSWVMLVEAQVAL